jgi:putative transposase
VMVTKVTRYRHNSLRLQGYDYSQNGAYFVTVVLKDRTPLFGDIVDGMMIMNDRGKAVQNVWENLPRHYDGISTDDFVVMPNHIHSILWIQNQPVGVGVSKLIQTNEGITALTNDSRPTLTSQYKSTLMVKGAGLTRHSNDNDDANKIQSEKRPAPTGKYDLSEVIRFFKSFSAKRINAMRNMSGTVVWQCGFYDHIIHDQDDLNRIRHYIQTNPLRWSLDKENRVL